MSWRTQATYLFAGLVLFLVLTTSVLANSGQFYSTTERVFPNSSLPKNSGLKNNTVIAAKGMHASFQIGFLPTYSGKAYLQVSSSCQNLPIDVYRVINVYLPSPSTGMRSKKGYYPDALAPQNLKHGSGMHELHSNRAAAWLVDIEVPRAYPAQDCSVDLSIYSEAGTILWSSNLTLKISAKRLPSRTSIHFPKLLLGWEMDNYRRIMGGKRELYAGTGSEFLREFGITPLNQWQANPNSNGHYSCPDMEMGSFSLGAVRVIPTASEGCPTPYKMTRDFGTSVKQDDRLQANASIWSKRVYSFWQKRGYVNKTTYVKNPFDEPSDVTPGMRYTMNKEVPKANRVLSQAMPGAKVFLASWPRDERKVRLCRTVSKKRVCTTAERDRYGNRSLWNGGKDDPHVWVIQPSRLYGRITPPSLRKYKYSRDHEYLNRLNKIKNSGKEIWSYNFFASTNRLPQTVIDAPAHHSRILMLQLGKEGFHGMYISNGVWWRDGKQSKTIINPWEKTPSYHHSRWGVGWGWGSYIYPGTNVDLGLHGNKPLPSLRLINMRNGSEEAAMLNLYRKQNGTAKAHKTIGSVFGKMITLPKAHGNTVWPSYSQSEAIMSSRIESMRWQVVL